MFKITSSSDMANFFDGVISDVMEDVEEGMAADLAEKARAQGLTSVDSYELDLQTDDPSVTINEARVRALANGILAAG
ncbi:hypothetical protein E3T37_03535 [Cryobacterium sp. TMT2-10]|uniref:hypothetical protein n=1 Tax=Cryobacterium sp. TMT2-10 TaxID=1259244 RepID=UPI00106B78A9|nr:hypothetical protein [Cryobacterium sp. TMT2-10]TFD41737.1 hypothetical protein E3T37_03535 [Cryobacterium sp. TMT2-10]